MASELHVQAVIELELSSLVREVRSFVAGCQIVHHSCELRSLSGADGRCGGLRGRFTLLSLHWMLESVLEVPRKQKKMGRCWWALELASGGVVLLESKCNCLEVSSKTSLVAQMVKNLPAMGRPGFNSWVGNNPWRREWQPTSVFLPGELHGQRSLVGYSPWVPKSQTRLSDCHTHISVRLERCRQDCWSGVFAGDGGIQFFSVKAFRRGGDCWRGAWGEWGSRQPGDSRGGGVDVNYGRERACSLSLSPQAGAFPRHCTSLLPHPSPSLLLLWEVLDLLMGFGMKNQTCNSAPSFSSEPAAHRKHRFWDACLCHNFCCCLFLYFWSSFS